MSEPLSVRCARRLGCDPGFYDDYLCGCETQAHAGEGGFLLPYGDDSPAGWACTGPLLGRFGLTLYYRRPSSLPSAHLAGWEASRPDFSPLDVLSQNPCAAIAEWVARFATDVEP